VETIEIKFVNAPTIATPEGPVTIEINFPIKNPLEIRTAVIKAEKKDVFTRFNLIKVGQQLIILSLTNIFESLKKFDIENIK
jgi:hypothetical protein